MKGNWSSWSIPAKNSSQKPIWLNRTKASVGYFPWITRIVSMKHSSKNSLKKRNVSARTCNRTRKRLPIGFSMRRGTVSLVLPSIITTGLRWYLGTAKASSATRPPLSLPSKRSSRKRRASMKNSVTNGRMA